MNLRGAIFLSSLCLLSLPVACGSDSDDDGAGGTSASGGAKASGGATASGGAKTSGGASGTTESGGTSGAGIVAGASSGGSSSESAGATSVEGGADTASGGKGGTSSGGSSSRGGATSAGAAGMSEGGQSEGGSAGASTGSSGAGSGGSAGGSAVLDCTLPDAHGAPSVANGTKTSDDPPAMTGGSISDGVYFETNEVDYHGQLWESPDNHRVAVFDKASGKFAEVQTNQFGAVHSSFVGRLTVTGNTFSVSAFECNGTSDTFTMQYTATPTTIAWVDPQTPNRVLNFVKQ